MSEIAEPTGVNVERRAKYIHANILDSQFDTMYPKDCDTFFKKAMLWVSLYPQMSGYETYQLKVAVLNLGIASGHHVARVPTDKDGNPWNSNSGPGLMYMPEEHLPYHDPQRSLVNGYEHTSPEAKAILSRYADVKVNPKFYGKVFLNVDKSETLEIHDYAPTEPNNRPQDYCR